jgi:hypothetical protein
MDELTHAQFAHRPRRGRLVGQRERLHGSSVNVDAS